MVDISKHYRMIIFLVVYGPYKDIYEIFLKQFRKNWPDCPYPLIIGNQYYPINEDNILTLDFDETLNGPQRLNKIINLIDADYYLGFEVDRLIMDKVDSSEVEKILDFMDSNNIKYFRCNASVIKKREKDKYTGYDHYYHIPAKEPYGVPGSTVIWSKQLRKEMIEKKLDSGYIWEAYQNKRAALSKEEWLENYATDDRNLFSILHCIEKQKWIRKSRKVLIKEGYEIDCTRECQSINETLFAFIKDLFKYIPGKTRYNIKNILKKFGLHFSTDY